MKKYDYTIEYRLDDINNYGLILNSSILGIEKCVDILSDVIKI